MKYCKSKHKKVRTFCEGDFVGVRIPKIDRSSTDYHRVMCVIVEKLGKKTSPVSVKVSSYCILCYFVMNRCEFGVLKNCFGEGDMELYEGKLDLKINDWESLPVLSLREAAIQASVKNKFHSGRCNCRTGCKKRFMCLQEEKCFVHIKMPQWK